MSIYLYLDKDTFFHRLDPRTKIIFLLTAFLLSVINKDPRILICIFFVIMIIAVLSKMAVNIIRMFWLLFLIGTLSVLIWLIAGGFSAAALKYGLTVSLKIIIMLISGLVFLSTTKNEEISAALRKLGLPYAVGFAISLALMLIPTFMNNVRNIYDAQRCRGVDLNKGSIIKRIKNYAPLLAPIFLVTLRSADQLSMALEAKGFGAKERTCYIDIYFKTADFAIIAFLMLALVVNTLLLAIKF